MARRLFAWFLPFLLAASPLADDLVLRDGTEFKECLVREEGLLVRLWPVPADFPAGSRVLPREQVKELRYRRGPEWDRHDELPDLTVTHILIEPLLPGFHGVYDYDATGAPGLKARLGCAVPGRIRPERAAAAIPDLGERNRQAPAEVVAGLRLAWMEGEELTLTAHVKNTGFAPAPPFAWRWLWDDRVVAAGRHEEALPAMAVAKFTIKQKWSGGDPAVSFALSPGGREICEANDRRADHAAAWAFDFFVSNRRIEYCHRHRNLVGSFSWEDYYQWHIDLMNDLFARSVHPAVPGGVRARVRVNRILYLEEVDDAAVDGVAVGEDGLIRNQGAWQWRDGEGDRRGEWHRPWDVFHGVVTEWSLPHELGHQLGLIDHYALDHHGGEAFSVAGREAPLRFSHFYRYPRVMMHWHGPHVFSETHAAYLDRTRGLARGIYGEFVFQTPARSVLLVQDVNGRPLEDAEVRIYQRGTRVIPGPGREEAGGVRWWEVAEDGSFPNDFPPDPVIVGRTGVRGAMVLPNRPVRPVRTLNGYERRPNPFGNMDVVGRRHLMLALVTKGGRTDPFFLELDGFNRACARGRGEEHVEVLKGGFPSPDGPPPPAAARLGRAPEGGWRLSWAMPDTGLDTSGRSVHRFRVYRRQAAEGLNHEPWDPVATLDAGARSCDPPSLPENPAHSVGGRRTAFGVTAVNERGVESGLVELLAPEIGAMTGLLRRGADGPFFLALGGETNLVALEAPGVYADCTPGSNPLGRAEEFASDARGRLAGTAWDRHGVALFGQGWRGEAWLGEPFRPGDNPGEFRHPRGVALDEAGNLAVADGDNRRVQLFAAADLWGRQGRIAAAPRLVLAGFGGEPFAARVVRVALGHGLLLALDERGRLHCWETAGELAVAEARGRVEAGWPAWAAPEPGGTFVVLAGDGGRLRRFDREGRELGQAVELGGERLDRARGLVRLADGRLATFQALDRLLLGGFRAISGG